MARIILYFYILLLCGSVILELPPQPETNRNGINIESFVGPKDKIKDEKQRQDDNEHKIPEIHISTEKTDDKKNKNISPSSNVTPSKVLVNNSNIKSNTNTEIESGAVMRGVYVFVGITMLFIMYIAFKTYRRNKQNVVIKKYGVRTRRSDIEMEPLPLEDDEDDETVFDVGNVNSR